jgi:predicted TIM-barrel fold metal-dependent hydrolase
MNRGQLAPQLGRPDMDASLALKPVAAPDPPGRRAFVASLASLAASLIVPECVLAQTVPHAPDLPLGSIDVHHHFAPPAYAAILQQKSLTPAPLVGWSLQKTLDDMDKAGIASAINSIVSPGVWFGDNTTARGLARDSNEYAAKLSADHPRRFGSFATLTLPDIEGSLRELEYALDTLKADGILLFTSYNDKWMGDPFFAPILEELNRRHAVLFIHPTTNACCANLLPGISSAKIEYGTDTTRAIVRMIYSGAAKRYPNIRVIFSHGGGTMPYLFTRFVDAHEGTDPRPEPDFQAEVSKFYYDTAQAFHPIPMNALKQAVPMSQILFGTDYPYRTPSESTTGLLRANVFNADELAMVQRKNALKLLARLGR